MRRELKAGEAADNDQRQIRAVVLTLPGGNVEAEGLWTVHDRARYLWMLKDGHFLLRDQNGLQKGDTRLILKPQLQFPGALLWLELDPAEQFMVSNSLEPLAAPAKPGDASSSSSASAAQTGQNSSGSKPSGGDDPEQPRDHVVRILHLDSGQVMLVTRLHSTIHLPINSGGYLESLRGKGDEWMLNLHLFTGGSRLMGSVNSACAPTSEFLSQQQVLVTACGGSGEQKLIAVSTEGKILWDDLNREAEIWPALTRSSNGLRLAQETLAVTRPVNAYDPLDADEVKAQLVRVFDAASGEQVFESPASPIFDAGGNAALSPSGRRVAVLNAGAIQVFELPAPPPLPDANGKQPAR
jgi:hypothetical protein